MRSSWLRLAACLVLLTTAGWVSPQSGPASTGTTPKPPPRKAAPAFTNDDLDRYREERLRRESPDPEPAPPTAGAHSSLQPTPPPAAKAGAGAIEIRDLNGTLPADARATAEAAGRRFMAFFGVQLDAPLVVPLRYFPDAEAYRDYFARNVDSQMSWTGYYDPMKGEIVVGSTPGYLALLLHELNHFVFDAAFDEAPVWLREGLAEYFETASVAAEGFVVADQPRHRRQLAEWLKGPEPDLRQLLALNYSTWRDHEVAGSARVRALAWSVIAFLMSSDDGNRALRDFLASLKEQRGLYSLAAIDRSFPGGASAFERRWLEYVRTRGKTDS